MGRPYRLGKRQAAADRTRDSILAAARELLAEAGPEVSLAAVARRAGVSRVTVYNRFGSRTLLWEALAGRHGLPRLVEPSGDARVALRERLEQACAAWAVDPALYRNLGQNSLGRPDHDRRLAEVLASADALRPGCSIKEAEDVIGALTSFAVFDRLHLDGRRSPSAVAGILQRLASGILA